MADFHTAHEFTARWEGGLTDHPADPGGITNHGVSLRWLRSLHHDLGDIDGDGDIDADDIRALSLADAARLFRLKFWEPYRLGDMPQRIAALHYDCTVNTGPRQAALIAQRACNSLVGPYGVKLAEDGVFGPKTREFCTRNATDKLAEAMLAKREAFYTSLARSKPQLAVFLKGWLNRCDDLRRTARAWV